VSDIVLKVATTREERLAAFRLIYHAYRQAGLCDEDPSELRFTPCQLLETTDILLAQLDGQVACTLSLVRDSVLGLPLEAIYPVEVARRRATGLHLAEVSCLAHLPEALPRFFELFRAITRLIAQLATKLGVDELLVAVHPQHVAIYRRYMSFEPLDGQRDYPTVCSQQAVGLYLNFQRAERESPRNWQRLFGEQVPASLLHSCPISLDDRVYFLSLIHLRE
jgi:hypothetical protein